MTGLLKRVARLLSPDEAKSTAALSPTPANPSPSADRREGVIRALRQQVAERSGGRLSADAVDPEGQMFDRGYLDSFSYVEFLAFIEHTYQVRIDDSQLAGHLSTIAAMADHILREESGKAS